MKGAKKAANFEEYTYHGYKSLTTNSPSKFSVKAMGYAMVMVIDKRDFLEFVAPAVHRNFPFECMFLFLYIFCVLMFHLYLLMNFIGPT